MDVGAAHRCRQRRDHVAVADEFDAHAGLAHLFDKLFVPRPVQNHHGQVAHGAVQTHGDAAQVRRDRPTQVDLARRGRPDDEFFHVGVGRLKQAAFFGDGDDRDRVADQARGDVRSLDRVDGDVYSPGVRPGPAYSFADVEHRRFVALALANDDFTVDVEFVQHAAHGVGARLVDQVRVALARHPARGDGRLFGDAHRVEDEGTLHVHADSAPVRSHFYAVRRPVA